MKFLSYDGLLYFCQKIKALLAGKVDKVDGKGLSTNDYTTAEKTKLAGLMNYIHPTTSGNKHIPAGGSANQILGWSADGTAKWVNEKDTTYSVMSGATVDADGKSGLVPSPTKGAQRWLDSTGAWTTPPNTTYGAASTTSAGLMSAADKKKLDGVADGANKYVHPATSGNKHIPVGGSDGMILGWSADGTAKWVADKDTTYTNFKGATADTAGSSGLVSAPAKGQQGLYLRGDGTWATPTNTTYNDATQSAHGLMTAADKTKLDGIAAGANKYVHPSYTAHDSGLYKITVDATGHVSTVTAVAKGDITALGIPSTNTTYNDATQSTHGLMSTADKKKLDGIAEGANKYSLPTATSSVLGGVKTGANITNNSGVLSVTAANVTNALGYTPPKQDTNTWRPVVNSLTSSATDQSLAANQGKILNESKAAMIVLTNENLNDVVTPGFYSSGGSNNVTNKPSNVDHFGLIVIHRASGSYYTQIVYSDSAAYRRHCVNGTWSGWVQDKLTDTDTWRGIQNNLTSDSTTDSLSAAQGKALKTLVDGKAAANHTHSQYLTAHQDISGKVDKSEAGANSLLATLTTTWTSIPTDNTYFVRQDTGGGNTFGRVKFSTLWSYIKGKGDATYQPKGSYAASSHTHDDRYYTESEIDAKLKTKADTHSHPYLPTAGGTVTGVTAFTNTTASTNKSTGAVKVSGGVGVAGRMSANEVMIGDGCTLRYDATNKCVNFTFS